jgi:hypothetical protein
MRHLASRSLLAILTAFLAVTTLAGAFFVVPTLPPEWIAGSIFPDYTVPALALGFVGGLSLVAFGAVVLRPDLAGVLAVAAGLAMVAFELVEIAVIGLSVVDYGADEPVAWLQIVYIAIGLLTAAAGFSLAHAMAAEHERRGRYAAHVAR